MTSTVNKYFVKLRKSQEIEMIVEAKSSEEAKEIAWVKLRTGEVETTTETEWEFAEVKGIHEA